MPVRGIIHTANQINLHKRFFLSFSFIRLCFLFSLAAQTAESSPVVTRVIQMSIVQMVTALWILGLVFQSAGKVGFIWMYLSPVLFSLFKNTCLCRCTPGWTGYRCESVAISNEDQSSSGRKLSSRSWTCCRVADLSLTVFGCVCRHGLHCGRSADPVDSDPPGCRSRVVVQEKNEGVSNPEGLLWLLFLPPALCFPFFLSSL